VNRDIRLDLLKALGVFCIILAHCNPPQLIFQLRNFDVPLMVIISGTLFYHSFTRKPLSYGTYLKKRVLRLVPPVWIFLTFFFVSAYGIYHFAGQHFPFTVRQVVGSFLLLNGIGYVWIIKVFILVAAVSPAIYQLRKRLPNNTHFLGILAGIYLLYELSLLTLTKYLIAIPWLSVVINDYLMYAIVYGCLAGLGMALHTLNKRERLMIAILCLGIFVAFSFNSFITLGHFIPTQEFKYPPRLYYLSYALGISTFLYNFVDKLLILFKQKTVVDSIVFVSANSMWIYLWHILALHYWAKMFPNAYFLLTFLVVTVTAVALTWIQILAQKKLI